MQLFKTDPDYNFIQFGSPRFCLALVLKAGCASADLSCARCKVHRCALRIIRVCFLCAPMLALPLCKLGYSQQMCS